MKNTFNIIHNMIEEYEKFNGEKPFAILVSPKIYINIREELENTNTWKYVTKLETEKSKINYIFGIPIEISNYIIQEAICMNETDYKKYLERFARL